MKKWKKIEAPLCISIMILTVIMIILITIPVEQESKKTEVQTFEAITEETAIEIVSETETTGEEIKIEESEKWDDNVNSVDLDAWSSQEEETTQEDLSSLVTSKQYTLGYGVRARTEPSLDAPIYTVYDQAFTQVDVIEEGDWYKCLIDNNICYIISRYIGDEEDVEYVKQKWKLEEKRKSSAYYSAFKNMTEEDEDLLVWILSLEAEGEDWEGKVAVVEVIMNRVISNDPTFPGTTIHDIVYQSGQFDSVNYLSHPYCSPTKEDYAIIDYVKDNGATVIRSWLDDLGKTDINSLDYVFFGADDNGTDIIVHGHHKFGRNPNKKYRHNR